ncbi:hypothetical protein BCL90_0966 [Pedobacter alluvionis]|uniref:Uncharacterized protein n=1 Tax=Pedobacter alluvionis TaxID=475253 RepID=A0A497YCK2_9SPHI|nr:hypothetical protein BCL90_0966 [Pedobacter alluvionis]
MLNNLTKIFRRFLPINILSITPKDIRKSKYPHTFKSNFYHNKGSAVIKFHRPVSKYVDYGQE